MKEKSTECASPRRVIFPTLHANEKSDLTSPHRLFDGNGGLGNQDPSLSVNAGFRSKSPDCHKPLNTSPESILLNKDPHSVRERWHHTRPPSNANESVTLNEYKTEDVLPSTSNLEDVVWSAGKEEESETSLPRLSTIREDEGTDSEFSEESSITSSLHRSLTSSIKFDPRVWVYEFERAPEEYDCVWFSAREMERFKKQALIRVYLHAVRQYELIATGTGRVIRRKVKIPKRALFSNPALAMDGDPDEDVLMGAEKEVYRKKHVMALDRVNSM